MDSIPFRLRHLDHVVLRVVDLAGVEAFYVDVLGAVVERRIDEIGLVQLRAGGSLIDLVAVDSFLGAMGGGPPAPEPADGGRNLDHLCLAVAPYDQDAILAHLDACGVAVGDVGDRYGAEGTGPSIYLWDPERNVVELKGPPHDPTEVTTRR